MKQKLLVLATLLTAASSAWAAVDDVFTVLQLKYRVTSEGTNVVEVDGQYEYHGNEVEVFGFETEPTGALDIPSYVFHNGTRYLVTSIGGSAFAGCSGLTSVTIPFTITYIGSDAFNDCVNVIDVYCFAGLGFEWPEDGDDFSVEGDTHFHVSNSSAWQAEYPDAHVWFWGDLYSTTQQFTSADGIIFRTMGDKEVEVIGYSGTKEEVTIPAELLTSTNAYDVTRIGAMAFADKTDVTSVNISEGILRIEHYAFSGCSNLTSVSIPTSVVTIGSYAFFNSGLTSVTIPEGVIALGGNAFFWCDQLKSVTIGSTVKDFILSFQEDYSVVDVYCYADVGFGQKIENFCPFAKLHVMADQLDALVEHYGKHNFVGDLDCPTLADEEDYTRTIDAEVRTATYRKTTEAEQVGKHQAWLLPFDYSLTADDLTKFDFYRIKMIADAPVPVAEPTDDELWVFLSKLEAGNVLRANMPYVIKPLEAVTDYTFTTANILLQKPMAQMLAKTETMEDIFEFYATYEPTSPRLGYDFYYVNTEGSMSFGEGDDSSVSVGPYRWIVRQTSKQGGTVSYAKRINFIDVEDATGIDAAVLTPAADTDVWYTLSGLRLKEQPHQKGVYIHNGRKVSVK